MPQLTTIDRARAVKAVAVVYEGVLVPSIARPATGRIRLSRYDRLALHMLQVARIKTLVLVEGAVPEGLPDLLEETGAETLNCPFTAAYTGVDRFLQSNGLRWNDLMMVGCDVEEIPALRQALFSMVPFDATVDAKAVAQHVARRNGGAGAFREAVELVLRNREAWDQVLSDATSKVAANL